MMIDAADAASLLAVNARHCAQAAANARGGFRGNRSSATVLKYYTKLPEVVLRRFVENKPVIPGERV